MASAQRKRSGDEVQLDGRAIARGRDKWLQSQEGRMCSSGTPHGIYLENRLAMAYQAGWAHALKAPEKK